MVSEIGQGFKKKGKREKRREKGEIEMGKIFVWDW